MADHDRIEQRLRQVPLRGPSRGMRDELMQRARLQMASRKRWRQLTALVVAAAVLLIVVNLAVGQMYAQSMAAVTGQPGISETIPVTPICVEAIRARKQLMTTTLELNGNGG
jgi:negative regulator of sigma E activity